MVDNGVRRQQANTTVKGVRPDEALNEQWRRYGDTSGLERRSKPWLDYVLVKRSVLSWSPKSIVVS